MTEQIGAGKRIGILTSGLACLFMLGIFAPRVGAAAALYGLAANYVVCIGLDAAHAHRSRARTPGAPPLRSWRRSRVRTTARWCTSIPTSPPISVQQPQSM